MREEEKNGLWSWQHAKDCVNIIEQSNNAMTMVHDGRIITCAGFWTLWPGVCDVWQVPSIYVPAVSRAYGREMRRYILRLRETFGFHRIQTVSPNDELHRRWLTWLGFEAEGLMKKYTLDKHDYLMWGKVWE